MAVASTDAFGAFFDTGSNTIPTVRGNVEVEAHVPTDVTNDTGAKFASLAALVNSHVPHRPANDPR